MNCLECTQKKNVFYTLQIRFFFNVRIKCQHETQKSRHFSAGSTRNDFHNMKIISGRLSNSHPVDADSCERVGIDVHNLRELHGNQARVPGEQQTAGQKIAPKNHL